MKPPLLTCQDRGFSLSEVSISIGIVAAVLLPLLAMLATGSKAQLDAEDTFAASHLSQTILEQLDYDPETDRLIMRPLQSPGNGQSVPEPPNPVSAEYLSFDAEGKFLAAISEAEFRSGLRARAGFEPYFLVNTSLLSASGTFAETAGAEPPVHVVISVERPAAATEINRVKTTFSSFRSLLD